MDDSLKVFHITTGAIIAPVVFLVPFYSIPITTFLGVTFIIGGVVVKYFNRTNPWIDC